MVTMPVVSYEVIVNAWLEKERNPEDRNLYGVQRVGGVMKNRGCPRLVSHHS